ncbi:MAG: vitamin B12 ABC transporter permease BtuC [Haloarculaceae archaeon]
MFARQRTVAWSLGLAGALVATILASATIGPTRIPPATVAKAALDALWLPVPVLAGGPGDAALFGLSYRRIHPFAFVVSETAATIVVRLRLPRVLLGAVVGMALGVAGTVMQGFFRNPMADPSVIGVSTGAAAGAVGYIVFAPSVPLGLQGAAVVGAVTAGLAVYLIASEGGRTPVATLLLAGVAIQTFLGAVISFTLLQAGQSLERAVYWLMGRLDTTAYETVGVTLLVVGPCVLVLYAFARELNALLLGEADAHTLGVDVERTKRLLLVVASALTALAVAVAGVIGFVGLVVPHVMRLLVGPDHRTLLPASALAGATFLVAADTVARAGAAELPVGIVTAALGAPFFLYLLRKREVHEL